MTVENHGSLKLRDNFQKLNVALFFFIVLFILIKQYFTFSKNTVSSTTYHACKILKQFKPT